MGLMWRSCVNSKLILMTFLKKTLQVALIVVMISSLTSCDSQKRMNKDFNYFQKGLDSIQNIEMKELKFTPNDFISIQVVAGSLRQEDAALFNLSSSSSSSL